MDSIYIKIRELSDEELLQMYEVDYRDYTEEELDIATEEVKIRGLKLQTWHYNDLRGKKGPVSKSDLISMSKSNEIKDNYLVKSEKEDEWRSVKDIDFLKQYFEVSEEENNIKESNLSKGERKAYVKVASILFLIQSGIWVLITLTEIPYILESDDVDFLLRVVWNIVVTVIGIVVGASMLKLKKFSYRWGMGTAQIGIVWYAATLYKYGSSISLILLIISIVIFFLLRNKEDLFIHE